MSIQQNIANKKEFQPGIASAMWWLGVNSKALKNMTV